MGDPVGEVLWLEPFLDDPEQSAVDGESVELAFVAQSYENYEQKM